MKSKNKLNRTRNPLINANRPRILRERILDQTELNAGHSVEESLSKRTSGLRRILRIKRNLVFHTLVGDAVNRTNDSSSTGHEALEKLQIIPPKTATYSILLASLHDLIDGELSLRDLELVPLSGELNDGLSGDTRKNGTVQRSSDEFLLA